MKKNNKPFIWRYSSWRRGLFVGFILLYLALFTRAVTRLPSLKRPDLIRNDLLCLIYRQFGFIFTFPGSRLGLFNSLKAVDCFLTPKQLDLGLILERIYDAHYINMSFGYFDPERGL